MNIDDIRFTERLADGKTYAKVVITSNTNHIVVTPKQSFEDKGVYEYLREMTFSLEIHLENFNNGAIEFSADIAKYRILGDEISDVLLETANKYCPQMAALNERIMKEVYSVVANVVFMYGTGMEEIQNQIEKQVVSW